MIQWGYNISKPRAIDIDKNDMSISEQILREMPELQSCIACGACTSTCTAGAITDFNLRKAHTLVRRGEYKEVYDMVSNCMLCGKCRLACPRGINTRAVVLLIKQKLAESK
ncbi:MAG: 4Fe-4S dicluster domain-containing protein [Rikenellaceae bacterium]